MMSEGAKLTAATATATATVSTNLQNMLQRAVQSVQWTYIIFWRLCSLQRILVWSDGYYNGAIKTRKTVQPKEVSAEEASLYRSQQLRELYYEMLSATTRGETVNNNYETKKTSIAALSPEDLTESEWFYLMCFSYSFPPGTGLPGRAYVQRQHVWLTGASEVDSHTFSRAILAKSAEIHTVVCIPLLDGVIEVGTTERVEQDLGFIQQMTNFFSNLSHNEEPTQAIMQYPPPKPVLSEHSTSNPSTISGYTTSPAAYIKMSHQAVDTNQLENDDDGDEELELDHDDNDDDDAEEEEIGTASCDDSDNVVVINSDTISSDHMMIHIPNLSIPQSQTFESSDLMQLDISSENIRSPDDASDDMDSSYHHILPKPTGPRIENQDTNPLEELGRWQDGDYALFSPSDTHCYSQTLAAILQRQSNWRCSDSSISSATSYIHYNSAFFKWSYSSGCSASNYLASSSQRKLKYILFTVPFIHNSKEIISSQKPSSTTSFYPASRVDLTGGANHVQAERRRREKLKERFITLRSLVPFVTKMDKASILGDTIEYLKQLHNKIQELEAQQHEKESIMIEVKEPKKIKKKMRTERGTLKAGHQQEKEEVLVEVSIIDKDALVEMQCPHREGLLLDVMQMLRPLRLEITTAQSSISNGLFVAALRAKVKENLKGKRATIMEVKKAIHQTVSSSKLGK